MIIMPDNWTLPENVIIPKIPEDSEFHESKWWNFDSKEYLSFLLHLMVTYEASDIYLTYWEPPALRIMQRTLRVEWADRLPDEVLMWFKNELLKDEYEEHFENEKAVDLWYSLHGRRYRVNVSLQRWHIMIVIRLLAEKVPTIDELWLPPILKNLAHRPLTFAIFCPYICRHISNWFYRVLENSLKYMLHSRPDQPIVWQKI